jgi:hypothetical protein
MAVTETDEKMKFGILNLHPSVKYEYSNAVGDYAAWR